MSFLSNANYEGIQSAALSGVISSTSYSFSGWMKFTGSVTDTANTNNCLIGLIRHDATAWHQITAGSTFNNIVRLRATYDVTAFTNPGNLLANEWVYVALTCAGTGSTDLKAYIWDASGTLIMSQVRTGSSISVPDYVHFGGASNYSHIAHHRCAYGRVWSSVLSQADLEDEMMSETPVNTSTILTAFAADSVTDVTGNSRNWTQRSGTTLDTSDNPVLTSYVKYLKMLVHPNAASVTSVIGAVFEAPTGGAVTGAKIGEFTGAAFASELDNGQAVLLVPVADFGGSALTTSSTPVALAKTSTKTTGVISCTVIEVAE